MKILVDPALMSFESGTFWAGICLEHEGYAFPERNWDDIALGVLAEWGAGCRFIIENEGVRERFYFFDGAYYFNCSMRNDELSVECVNDGKSPFVERVFIGSASEFLASFISSFDRLHDAYLNSDSARITPKPEASSIKACVEARVYIEDYLRRTVRNDAKTS